MSAPTERYALPSLNADGGKVKRLVPISNPLMTLNVMPISIMGEDILNAFRKIRSCEFTYTPEAIEKTKVEILPGVDEDAHMGVSAQDVEAVLPEAVIDNGNGHKLVDTKEMTMANTAAIAELASVESIGDEAFKGCSSLDNIVMNNGLKTIGDRICDSSNITELYIPTSVESIGLNAFTELVNLKKITVDKPSQSLDGAPWGAPNAEVKWILQNT